MRAFGGGAIARALPLLSKSMPTPSVLPSSRVAS